MAGEEALGEPDQGEAAKVILLTLTVKGDVLIFWRLLHPKAFFGQEQIPLLRHRLKQLDHWDFLAIPFNLC